MKPKKTCVEMCDRSVIERMVAVAEHPFPPGKLHATLDRFSTSIVVGQRYRLDEGRCPTTYAFGLPRRALTYFSTPLPQRRVAELRLGGLKAMAMAIVHR